MRITRWGEYGILCCLYLARRYSEGAVGASEIAEKQSIPTQYAQQILHRLRKGGIIKSIRGPRGGFMLTKEPTQTNLREVLLAAEGHTFELICEADPVYHQSCHNSPGCGLRGVWQDLQGAINQLLESRTLAGLLELGIASVGDIENHGLVPGPRAQPAKKTMPAAATINAAQPVSIEPEIQK